jgi:hypothetical protein
LVPAPRRFPHRTISAVVTEFDEARGLVHPFWGEGDNTIILPGFYFHHPFYRRCGRWPVDDMTADEF